MHEWLICHSRACLRWIDTSNINYILTMPDSSQWKNNILGRIADPWCIWTSITSQDIASSEKPSFAINKLTMFSYPTLCDVNLRCTWTPPRCKWNLQNCKNNAICIIYSNLDTQTFWYCLSCQIELENMLYSICHNEIWGWSGMQYSVKYRQVMKLSDFYFLVVEIWTCS